MRKRPHIIIFNPDEMRWDTMAHMGNPAAVTPNLDAFAREDAVSFSNAFCQNPVCVPSRCSFFTGLYPHVRGHRTMSYLLHPGEETLLSELKNSGYYVWMNDRNDLTAGQIRGWTESHADEIYYSNQKSHGPGPENPALRGSLGDKYYYSHFRGKLKTDAQGVNYNNDDEIVDAAIHRIQNPIDGRPMCLFLGLMYPHVPYQIEEPYYSQIDRNKLPDRIRYSDTLGKAKIIHDIHYYQNMQNLSEDEWNELRSVYLGMCTKIDAQFGRLIAALKDKGIYDDCAIFFLSDHGDFAGDYGLVEKAQNSFEDCLTRVPFLIKPPKDTPIVPGVNAALTELIDFYATVLDFADVAPTHTHFGRSLRKNLADPSLPGRTYVFSEGGRQPGERHCDEYHVGDGVASTVSDYWPKQVAQADDEAHSKGIMIRSEQYKYISRTAAEDEFYDLQKDPSECHNRISDPAYTEQIRIMQTAMLKWLQATSDIVPFEPDARFTPEMLWAKVRHMVPLDKEEEVRQLIASGIELVPLMIYCRKYI